MAYSYPQASISPNPLFQQASDDTLRYSTHVEESRMDIFDTEAQLVRGTLSFSKEKLRQLDPSYTGYTQIFVLRLPEFIKAIASGNVITEYKATDASVIAAKHLRSLKTLIELGSTSYSGTPDLTLNTSEQNLGTDDYSYSVPTTSSYGAKQFNLNIIETRGEPLRRALEYWITGMSDPVVKATFLHGATDDYGTPLQPTLDMLTMSIMVVQTDQTLRNIQDVSIWNNVLPTSAPRSHMDWEQGSIDIVPAQNISLQGVYMPDGRNKVIHANASMLLANRMQYFKTFGEMSSTELGIDYWTDTNVGRVTSV